MSTSEEEIKEEIMDMFYHIITGDAPNELEKAYKLEAYWNSFLTRINDGYIFKDGNKIWKEGENK